jgi:acyl-CoA hydrolase
MTSNRRAKVSTFGMKLPGLLNINTSLFGGMIISLLGLAFSVAFLLGSPEAVAALAAVD